MVDRLPSAGQHEADRGHLGEVGRADGSALRHDGVDTGVEQPDQGVEDVRMGAGPAVGHAHDADQHHRSHVLHRHRVADAARMHGEQLVLVVDHVFGQDLSIS